MQLTAVANKGKVCNTYGIFGIRPFAMVSFGFETFAMANRKLFLKLVHRMMPWINSYLKQLDLLSWARYYDNVNPLHT